VIFYLAVKAKEIKKQVMGKPTLLHVILGYCLFAARTGFSSIALAAGNNTTPASEKNMTGECKWNVLNSVLVSTLLVSTMVNVFAAVILFRVPLITSRGRSNPVYLCIRCLNLSDIAQVKCFPGFLFLLILRIFSNKLATVTQQVCPSRNMLPSLTLMKLQTGFFRFVTATHYTSVLWKHPTT